MEPPLTPLCCCRCFDVVEVEHIDLWQELVEPHLQGNPPGHARLVMRSWGGKGVRIPKKGERCPNPLEQLKPPDSAAVEVGDVLFAIKHFAIFGGDVALALSDLAEMVESYSEIYSELTGALLEHEFVVREGLTGFD